MSRFASLSSTSSSSSMAGGSKKAPTTKLSASTSIGIEAMDHRMFPVLPVALVGASGCAAKAPAKVKFQPMRVDIAVKETHTHFCSECGDGYMPPTETEGTPAKFADVCRPCIARRQCCTCDRLTAVATCATLGCGQRMCAGPHCFGTQCCNCVAHLMDEDMRTCRVCDKQKPVEKNGKCATCKAPTCRGCMSRRTEICDTCIDAACGSDYDDRA